jgi:hypothetical protein
MGSNKRNGTQCGAAVIPPVVERAAARPQAPPSNTGMAVVGNEPANAIDGKFGSHAPTREVQKKGRSRATVTTAVAAVNEKWKWRMANGGEATAGVGDGERANGMEWNGMRNSGRAAEQ